MCITKSPCLSVFSLLTIVTPLLLASFRLSDSRFAQPAYGEEFTPDKNYFRPLDVLTNTFCSSGQLGDDGTFYSIGGTTNDPNQKLMNGAGSVRKFVPCDGGPQAQCGFSLQDDMTVRRWYPTSQILPDGRFFIIGGGNETGNLAINNYMVNNPNYEFWPRKPNEGRSSAIPLW